MKKNKPTDRKRTFAICGLSALCIAVLAGAWLLTREPEREFMTELLENENIFCADEWEEKKKRIAALGRLTKRQQTVLCTEVTAFITRYLELSAAFDTIEAVINELDYHQSAIARKDAAAFPPAAYV